MIVTYLLGAGASFYALPVLDTLPERMRHIAHVMETTKLTRGHEATIEGQTRSYRDLAKEIAEQFRRYARKAEEFSSIDTYAKILFLNGDHTELHRLKITLMTFFALAETSFDPRYISFYASVFPNNHLQFPDKIRILSWNYDFQLEGSYEYLFKRPITHAVRTKNCDDYVDPNRFGIYKLNGTAAYYISPGAEGPKRFAEKLDDSEDFHWHVLLRYTHAIRSTFVPGISYAWERSGIFQDAKRATAETQILVIIGYSFPFFNREIDQEIMANMNDLDKIYIQDPYAEVIKDRLQAIRSMSGIQVVTMKEDKKQFVLPHELKL
jgi:hypothetical protein